MLQVHDLPRYLFLGTRFTVLIELEGINSFSTEYCAYAMVIYCAVHIEAVVNHHIDF